MAIKSGQSGGKRGGDKRARLVRVQVPLGREAARVDEDVGVGRDPGDRARDVIIQAVHLLPLDADGVAVQELRRERKEKKEGAGGRSGKR